MRTMKRDEGRTAQEKESLLEQEEQATPEEEQQSVVNDLPSVKGDDVVAMNNRLILDLNKTETPGWQGSFGQSIINNYGNDDGILDTEKMTNDWVNAGGTVNIYTGIEAQNMFSSLQNSNSSEGINNNLNNTNNTTSSVNTNPWSDITSNFDVFSFGGGGFEGGSGGGATDKYGNLDWKNMGLSLMDNVESTRQKDKIYTADQDCDES